ncbi:MAG TPA: plastocyanin/azurin family copper-binding protein [Gemmatimonadales bacterium]|jgi:plastocyanin|nr:plastocyanin/azurin family copper-binding protein [Gemmatimonadales bacterium]
MRGYSGSRALAVGSLVVLMAWGCGGDDNSPNTPTVTVAKAPSKDGDQQTGNVGEPLLSALRVSVTSDGNPQSGSTVTWSTSDGGSFEPSSNVTGADGIGATVWTLGPTGGAQHATAAVQGATGSPVTFTATAIGSSGPPPADPTEIAVTVGNNFFSSDRNHTSNPAVDTLAVNGTVTWTWNGTAGSHSVRSKGSPSFVSSLVETGAGQTYVLVFTETGTYDYDCAIHGSAMTGRIVVR